MKLGCLLNEADMYNRDAALLSSNAWLNSSCLNFGLKLLEQRAAASNLPTRNGRQPVYFIDPSVCKARNPIVAPLGLHAVLLQVFVRLPQRVIPSSYYELLAAKLPSITSGRRDVRSWHLCASSATTRTWRSFAATWA